ncbi:hypothetical protein LJC11_04095 [Bacteroidales bacterium OttesenSCG-928-I21]|nr:hypothetical protein [Bacteroidales bacterium OttesenSCG-928-I21]
MDGATAYVSYLGGERFITSNYNLGISEGYNSKTGYVYTKRDLELRRKYSGTVFLRLIRENEANGLAEPIGLNDWIDFHGKTYYNMYRLAAGTSLAFQFIGAPTGQSMPRMGGYNLKMSGGNVTVNGGGRIVANSAKEYKSLILQLSKPGSQLTKVELQQFQKLTKQFGGTLRYDLNPVKGKILKPHIQVEGLGSKVGSRHIWLEEGAY